MPPTTTTPHSSHRPSTNVFTFLLARSNEDGPTDMQRGEEPTYLDIHVGHEDGKIGEMSAGARGVRPVGAQQAAVLRGPVAGHGSLGVAPERTVGVEVLLRLLFEREKILKYTTRQMNVQKKIQAGFPPTAGGFTAILQAAPRLVFIVFFDLSL